MRPILAIYLPEADPPPEGNKETGEREVLKREELLLLAQPKFLFQKVDHIWIRWEHVTFVRRSHFRIRELGLERSSFLGFFFYSPIKGRALYALFLHSPQSFRVAPKPGFRHALWFSEFFHNVIFST